MATNTNRKPGTQTPSKYPFVGNAYLAWGEQPGYLYDPYTDSYYIDPKSYQEMYKKQGLIKEKPGLGETLLPIGLGAAALWGGTEIGKEIPGLIKEGIGGIGESLGIGGGAAGATGATAATSALPGAIAPESMILPGAAAPSQVGTAVLPATTEAGGGLFSLGGVGSAGNAILPLAGAAGIVDLVANRRGGVRGPLQGAASGAAIGSFFPGAGTLIGAGVGGLLGLGMSILGQDKDMWKTEKENLQKLQEKGAFVPENLLASMPTRGRKKEELVDMTKPANYVGYNESGNWVNNKFATSRKESDLTGADIVNYSAFAERDPNWFMIPLDQRVAYADAVLKSGAVNEHHGTIDIDWDKAPAFGAAAPPNASASGPVSADSLSLKPQGPPASPEALQAGWGSGISTPPPGGIAPPAGIPQRAPVQRPTFEGEISQQLPVSPPPPGMPQGRSPEGLLGIGAQRGTRTATPEEMAKLGAAGLSKPAGGGTVLVVNEQLSKLLGVPPGTRLVATAA